MKSDESKTVPVRQLAEERNLDQPHVDTMFNEMAEQRSDSMDFVLNREPEPNRTFSSDGLDDLMTAIQLFIGARVSAHFKARKPGEFGPHRMSVSVKVGIDGESWDVGPNQKPWYSTVDGDVRGTTVRDS